MNNRRYEKIKEYTRVMREEVKSSLGFNDHLADKLLIIAIKDRKGSYVPEEDLKYFWNHVDISGYILIDKMVEELIEFMEGGLLPEEA
jgi:hypothetical protein